MLAPRGGLKSIQIVSDIITDRGIELLTEHNVLESLLLSGVPKVTDASLDSIARCSSIRELYLTGTTITDSRLECLKELPKLWSLSIGNTSITDEGISKIASRTISLISFENCAIEGHGIRALAGQTPTLLHIQNSNIDRRGIEWIVANLPVQALDVAPAQMPQAEAQTLVKPQGLRINVYE